MLRRQVGSADDDGDRAAGLRRGTAPPGRRSCRRRRPRPGRRRTGALRSRWPRSTRPLPSNSSRPCRVESPVARAGGDDHRASGDVGPVGRGGRRDARPPPAARSPRTGAVRCGAELLRLHDGALGEVAAGDAGREAEVVLDPRAGPGLAADRDHLDAQRPQSLRRSVHRGREPGRTAADHDQVEAALGNAAERQPEVLGQVAGGRPAQHRPGGDHDRQFDRRNAELAQHRPRRQRPDRGRPIREGCGCGQGTPGLRSDSGENRDPTTRRVEAAPRNSTDRRARNAARIMSPNAGCVAITRRSAALGTTMTSPGSTTRAETNTRMPVSRFSSPRNCPGPCRVTNLFLAVGSHQDLDARRRRRRRSRSWRRPRGTDSRPRRSPAESRAHRTRRCRPRRASGTPRGSRA